MSSGQLESPAGWVPAVYISLQRRDILRLPGNDDLADEITATSWPPAADIQRTA